MCDKAIKIVRELYEEERNEYYRKSASGSFESASKNGHAAEVLEALLETLQSAVEVAELDDLASQELSSNYQCPICNGTVGHRPNCPDGIAFIREEE